MHADLRAAIDAVAAASSVAGEQWTVREETDADQPFVDALYRSTRWAELEQVPWPDEAKRQFLDSQSRLQADHYRRNYPGALLGVLECAGVPAGRLYLHASPGEFRLMDIVLQPERRGRGLGERMLRALMQVAQTQGRSITLHVEPNNPAQRLYARLGFALIEDRGVYHFLGWSPPS